MIIGLRLNLIRFFGRSNENVFRTSQEIQCFFQTRKCFAFINQSHSLHFFFRTLYKSETGKQNKHKIDHKYDLSNQKRAHLKTGGLSNLTNYTIYVFMLMHTSKHKYFTTVMCIAKFCLK